MEPEDGNKNDCRQSVLQVRPLPKKGISAL
jgi:hypothetical protein